MSESKCGASGFMGEFCLTALFVSVVFVVPVTFVHLPALLVVVVVGMAPVGASVGRALPDAWAPDVASTVISPVAFGPYIALAGHCGTDFDAQRGWGATDIHMDLSYRWSGARDKS